MTVVAHAGGWTARWSLMERLGWWWLFGSGEIPGGLFVTDAVMPAGTVVPS